MKNFKKLLFLLAAVALVSCGEKKEKEAQIDNAAENIESITEEVKTANDETLVEITITADDQMKFNLAEIKVKSWQTVRLTLNHVGKMDKNVMGHNWVLLHNGADVAKFGALASEAKATDYIPANSDKVLAHTKILGGGESETIEFKAPSAGTYDFICSFPGHYALMKGKFIVE